MGRNDARTGMPSGMPEGAMCVQRLDDSLNSAIRITYRSSLRSSSMPEPRDPLLKVLIDFAYSSSEVMLKKRSSVVSGGWLPGGEASAEATVFSSHGWEVGRPKAARTQ